MTMIVGSRKVLSDALIKANWKKFGKFQTGKNVFRFKKATANGVIQENICHKDLKAKASKINKWITKGMLSNKLKFSEVNSPG